MRKPEPRSFLNGFGATFALILLTGGALSGGPELAEKLQPPPPAASGAVFDGTRAFEDLKRLVAFGPRPSGSKALSDARQWIIGQIEQTGLRVEEDSFVASTPAGNIQMTNLLVKIHGESSQVVVIAGHYDTKRFDDFKFAGANDGASSAAFLLEMARVLAHRKNKLTVWLVCFDGEEAIASWTNTDSLYGSRHLVEKLTSSGELGRIGAMILVDMIGDAKLNIDRDGNSTPWLTDIIFTAAHRLGYGKVFLNERGAYGDDHIPFVNAGVAAVDLLGNVGPVSPSASFGSYWHTAQDTVEHCSPVSLTIVGRVVTAALGDLEASTHTK
jgi:glutaminyl-peptide cyclotransferase